TAVAAPVAPTPAPAPLAPAVAVPLSEPVSSDGFGQREAEPVRAPLDEVTAAPTESLEEHTLDGVVPAGVAGEPVPSPAPAAFSEEPTSAPSAPAAATPAPAAAPPVAAPAAAAHVVPKGFGTPQRPSNLQYSAPTVDGGDSITSTAKIGAGGVAAPSAGPTNTIAANEGPRTGQVVGSEPARNAPCPCGSGKKYKRCHGDPRNR
ncbi:MAG: SEC-C metal-binding domain-containing protein, partial [Mycobacteriales bacterium]